MQIKDLDIHEEAKQILSAFVDTLNEPQELAVHAGLLERKSIVVASPTASGKTLIAEMAMLKNFYAGGKTLYLVPLKALGSEKHAEFTEKYGNIMKIALSLGDYDTDSKWLERYDVIITSNEKADSLLRHGTAWLNDINLVIADEIHMIDDVSRGPTLEIVLTTLRTQQPHILALSATISNAAEIAKWLGAELVESNYRPVKLYKGVYYPTTLDIEEKDAIQFNTKEDSEIVLAKHALEKGKQSLVFVASRRSAEAAAEKISTAIAAKLPAKEKIELEKIAKKALSTLSPPTQQCKRLAACIARGTAFHHAGLVAAQRSLIENAFKAGLIKTLTATPTLAFGVNTPAYRVVVRDTKRFAGSGAEPLSVMEVQQMCGRAGRPKYDKEGEAILVASSEQDGKKLRDRYIYGETEPIYSKLSSEPVLRTHVLALIASQRTENEKELENFFSKTFFAHQYSDLSEVMKRVTTSMKLLESLGFVERRGPLTNEEFVPALNLETSKLAATPLGKRVAELYIDPLSAATMLEETKKEQDELDTLITICRCMEMKPLLYVKKSDYFVEDALLHRKDVPDEWSYEYDGFAAATKTALMLADWCDEHTEQYLNEKYNITPGELYTKTQNAEWLLFSAAELARLSALPSMANHYRKMQVRVKSGVKEELLKLIQLRGIGRARARALYKNGIRNMIDIKKASMTTLQKILGSAKLAESIKKQCDEDFMRQMADIKKKGKYKSLG